MKQTFYIFLFLIGLQLTVCAQSIERKIIIEKGVFYYTTVDEEFQVATLHMGSVKANESLKKAIALALPAGRNYEDPIIPFAWDVSGDNCFAVNWAVHPLIDRNEALKKIPLKELKGWNEQLKPQEMLSKSADYNSFTNNVPYQFILKKSNTLKGFFFDAISLNDSTVCMAIANNEQLSYWVYNGKAWDHIEVGNVILDGYFSLFSKGKDVYLAFSDGRVFSMSPKQIKPVPTANLKTALTDVVLIVNKDEQNVKFISKTQLDQNTPIKELITKKATLIL